jgi:hypothetical protein
MEIFDPVAAGLNFLSKPALLHTESRSEFDALRKALEREIRPKGIVEQMYVSDIGFIAWEILRLRRCKIAIINSGYLQALKDVVAQVSQEPPKTKGGFSAIDLMPVPLTDEEQNLANLPFEWFHLAKAKKEVTRMLGAFGLDESAIEARAIHAASEDLDWLERMLISLENRRDKFLRELEAYGEGFAKKLRASTDRIIEAEFDDVPSLPASPATASSAA